MTGTELRVLEARMDNLNAMLQDIVRQLRRIQTPGKADHGQQVVTDLARWLAWRTPGHIQSLPSPPRVPRWPGAVTSTIKTRFWQPRGSAVPGRARS